MCDRRIWHTLSSHSTFSGCANNGLTSHWVLKSSNAFCTAGRSSIEDRFKWGGCDGPEEQAGTPTSRCTALQSSNSLLAVVLELAVTLQCNIPAHITLCCLYPQFPSTKRRRYSKENDDPSCSVTDADKAPPTGMNPAAASVPQPQASKGLLNVRGQLCTITCDTTYSLCVWSSCTDSFT